MEFNILGFEFGIGRPPARVHTPQRMVGEKISDTAPIIYQMYAGNENWGVWTKRDFKQYASEAYVKCLPAYRSINMIAKSASEIPLRVMQGDKTNLKKCRQLPSKHPLVKLLNKPNPTQNGKVFFNNVISYLMLTGNSYVEGIGQTPRKNSMGDDIDGGGGPVELWTQRPDRMRVLPSKMGVAGFIYDFNADTKRWDMNPIDNTGPICHIKFFNPLDDWYGMSPVEAASMEIDGRNMSGKWNQSLLQNGAKPSGALVYKPAETDPANLTVTQKEAIKEQINDGMVGPNNAGRIPILDGRLEWMQMSLTPAEMDWLESRNAAARDVVQAFGVPPMMLGIPGDNTYSNMEEARCAFHQDTVIPVLGFICDHLNSWLCPLYGEDIFIMPYIDEIPALAPVREKLWTRVTAATWMTVNEKRSLTGFDALPLKEADEVFIASGLIPLTGSMDQPDTDEFGNPIEDPDADPDAEEDPKKPFGGKPKPGDKPKPGKIPPKKDVVSLYERMVKAEAKILDIKYSEEQPRADNGQFGEGGSGGPGDDEASDHAAVAANHREATGAFNTARSEIRKVVKTGSTDRAEMAVRAAEIHAEIATLYAGPRSDEVTEKYKVLKSELSKIKKSLKK